MISIIKKTKCITTLGPSSNSYHIIKKIIENGSICCRLNFSHGTYDEHLKKILIIKKISEKKNIPIAIILDTKGPEIRTHNFINGSAKIKKNKLITIINNEEILGNDNQFSVNYLNLKNDIKIDNKLLLNDGKLILKVISIENNNIICKALNTYIIKDKSSINIPNVKLSLPFLSEQDKKDLIFGCRQKINYVAASFVYSSSNIKEIRNFLDNNDGKHIQIIAKIESQLAVNNFDEILAESDAIMIARGDLGVEIPFEKIPFLEREWIKKCRNANKPIIVATQMLDSMINNPYPTRAEVTDVWIAMNWGATCTMLSGETANGNYPILSIKTMSKILIEAEIYQKPHTNFINLLNLKNDLISKTINKIIKEKPNFLITNSQDSNYIKTISNANLSVFIIPIVNNIIDYNKFAINFGIYTFLFTKKKPIKSININKLIKNIIQTYSIPIKSKLLLVDINKVNYFDIFIV